MLTNTEKYTNNEIKNIPTIFEEDFCASAHDSKYGFNNQ